MFKGLQPILYGGREVWPLVEGGKGVSATNHMSSGAWAAAGGIGTVSAVNADSYDPEGKIIPQIYRALTRRERHEELIQYAIDGAVEQVKRAYEHRLRQGRDQHQRAVGDGRRAARAAGRAGAHQGPRLGRHLRRGHALQAVRDRGRAYKSATCRSSAPRAPSARCGSAPIHKAAEWLSAVVYEDPWKAGGHNGLSNAEDPLKPEDPYPRVKALRETMREGGIPDSTSDRDGRRRLVPARVGQLDRQSGARRDRLPVRHAAAADAGKPDSRGLEAAADDAERRRRAAASLLADRLLFVGGAQPVPAQSGGALRAPDRLLDARRRATTSSSSTSA